MQFKMGENYKKFEFEKHIGRGATNMIKKELVEVELRKIRCEDCLVFDEKTFRSFKRRYF